ncbi:Serine/threonine-protein phosphatase 2A regulatory subunit B'' subunit alpha [Sorochytrium milnesiophthora]
MKSLPFVPQSLVCCPQESVDAHLRALISGAASSRDSRFLRKHLSPRALEVLDALVAATAAANNTAPLNDTQVSTAETTGGNSSDGGGGGGSGIDGKEEPAGHALVKSDQPHPSRSSSNSSSTNNNGTAATAAATTTTAAVKHSWLHSITRGRHASSAGNNSNSNNSTATPSTSSSSTSSTKSSAFSRASASLSKRSKSTGDLLQPHAQHQQQHHAHSHSQTRSRRQESPDIELRDLSPTKQPSQQQQQHQQQPQQESTIDPDTSAAFLQLLQSTSVGERNESIARLRADFRKRLHAKSLDRSTLRLSIPADAIAPILSPAVTDFPTDTATDALAAALAKTSLEEQVVAATPTSTVADEPTPTTTTPAQDPTPAPTAVAPTPSSTPSVLPPTADVKRPADPPAHDSGIDLSVTEKAAATAPDNTIPRFHFPHGRPRDNERQHFSEIIARAKPVFAAAGDVLSPEQFRAVTVSVLQLPTYSNLALMRKLNRLAKSAVVAPSLDPNAMAVDGRESPAQDELADLPEPDTIKYTTFVRGWRVLSAKYFDTISLLFGILKRTESQQSLSATDFADILDDALSSHPGLLCIRDSGDFQLRYRETVLGRFWHRNNLPMECITLPQFRKSGFIHDLTCINEQNDINAFRCLFSYNYFYVIYCKFIELDIDKDQRVSADDIARRYHPNTIPFNLIQRIAQGCGLGKQRAEPDMPYSEFIWFLISDHDKQSITSREYWFRVFDLDGDGVISIWELEQFNNRRPIDDSMSPDESNEYRNDVCEFLDAVTLRKKDGLVYLSDVRKSKTAGLFYDFFVNHLSWDEWAARTTGGGLAIRNKKEFERREVKDRLLSMSQNLIDLDESQLNDFDHFVDQEFCMLIDEPGGQPVSEHISEDDSGSESGASHSPDSSDEERGGGGGGSGASGHSNSRHNGHGHQDRDRHQGDADDNEEEDDEDGGDDDEDLDFFAPASSTTAATTSTKTFGKTAKSSMTASGLFRSPSFSIPAESLHLVSEITDSDDDDLGAGDEEALLGLPSRNPFKRSAPRASVKDMQYLDDTDSPSAAVADPMDLDVDEDASALLRSPVAESPAAVGNARKRGGIVGLL